MSCDDHSRPHGLNTVRAVPGQWKLTLVGAVRKRVPAACYVGKKDGLSVTYALARASDVRVLKTGDAYPPAVNADHRAPDVFSRRDVRGNNRSGVDKNSNTL